MCIYGRSQDEKPIRALAIDLDGTLLAPGAVLSERSARALKLCIKRGIRIIIATGRAMEAAEPFRSSLGAEGPMIYYNGAVVADMPSNKIIKTSLMDKKVAEYCVDLADDMGVYCQVYVPGERISLFASRDSAEREMYHKHTGILSELGDLKEILKSPALEGCVKAMFLAEGEILDAVREKVVERFGRRVYVAKTLGTFLEVMDAKVSKGRGLKLVMDRCSLSAAEVMAFGDEESDIPMFAEAAFSAAPSNAKDAVKARANMVIASNAEDGVAVFLENFFDL